MVRVIAVCFNCVMRLHFAMTLSLLLATLLAPQTSSARAALSESSGGSGYSLTLGLKALPGSNASTDGTSVKSRSMLTYGGEVILGYRLASFVVGAAAEYNLWMQSTDPTEVAGTNTQGNQLNLAPVIGVRFGKFLFMLKPFLASTLNLSKTDASGNSVAFTSPKFPSGAVQLDYFLGQHSALGVEYTNTKYSKAKVAGVEATLADSAMVSYNAVGLVYGYTF